MATITATKSGNWSDTTVWDLARVPADGDLVQAGDYIIEFDVDINQPNTVLAAGAGYYQYSGEAVRNVTANANTGTHTGGVIVQNTSTETLHFYGEIAGGISTGAVGAYNAGGSMTVGTATGGSAENVIGAYNDGGSMTVGTATGGISTGAVGAYNANGGSMTVGTATGGSGQDAVGAYNSSSSMHCDLAVGNDYGSGGLHSYPCPGVVGSNGGVTTVKRVQSGPHGQAPTGGSVYLEVDATNSAQFATHSIRDPLTLYPAAGGNIGPAPIVIGGGGIRIS